MEVVIHMLCFYYLIHGKQINNLLKGVKIHIHLTYELNRSSVNILCIDNVHFGITGARYSSTGQLMLQAIQETVAVHFICS